MNDDKEDSPYTGTYTIDITNNNSDFSSSLFTSTPYENATTVSTVNFDPTDITLDIDPYPNSKRIDLDLLEKYPAAKSLYNQFISVYNMCEAEEELNGESDAGKSF